MKKTPAALVLVLVLSFSLHASTHAVIPVRNSCFPELNRSLEKTGSSCVNYHSLESDSLHVSLRYSLFPAIWHMESFTAEYKINRFMTVEATGGWVAHECDPGFTLQLHGSMQDPSVHGYIAGAGVKFVPSCVRIRAAHNPFRGLYVKPEILFSQFTNTGMSRTYVEFPSYSAVVKDTDLKVSTLACMVNLGMQHMLGAHFVLGYSFGFGYCAMKAVYSNPDYFHGPPGYDGLRQTTNDKVPDNLYAVWSLNRGHGAFACSTTLGFVF